MLLLIENIFLILIMTNHIIFIGDIVGTLARPIDLSQSDDEEIRESVYRRISQRNTTNASPREQVTGRARNNALDRMDRISELPNRSRFERVVDRFYWLDEQKLRKNCSTREQICAICQDNFNQDNHVKILPCRHMFHFKCLRRSVCIYRQNTCPNCRSEIPSRDIER
ncbi:MAG: RING finger protein [Fimbriimonas sp.]|jgi:hypothetical protein